ncbi:PhoP regulatory network YrbL family protein [Yoonia sp. F2084L]|uniref:YrbL family protein n=1 Tax=Yoonia sp. F2084L TaxID=2926419 RepID=UPI001FF53D52|nr:YrbL family protein [Yoonia sp. F2084L]MCK0096146.1 PhoP regulatory network YrbL family protein [Yoonia sp. F2084L]
MVPMLYLDPENVLASGTQRAIYRHPTDPEKLVKVLRDIPLTTGRARLATLTEKYFPHIRKRWARKEYQEYLRLMLGPWPAPIHPPISHMYGFVQTNLGLACLSDAVLDNDALGTTLKSKSAAGPLTSEDLALLNDTIARLYRYDVRAGDMTARNFVFGHRQIGGVQGPRECVLVDGFGDIHAIPVRSWGRFFNRFGLDDGCKRLAHRTGLTWDPTSRQFSL